MDDNPNNRQKRHLRHRGWQFTFCGRTSEIYKNKGEQTQLAAKLAQDKLLFPLSSTQVGDRLMIDQILSDKGMMRQLSN